MDLLTYMEFSEMYTFSRPIMLGYIVVSAARDGLNRARPTWLRDAKISASR